MRHYKFALGIFLIIAVALLGIGIFYPHEEENVHISLDQSNGRDGNQNERGSEKLSKETTHGNSRLYTRFNSSSTSIFRF